MFWDKKKKEGLPDLPMAPTAPVFNLPHREETWHREKTNELPAFPDSPLTRGFSQSAIKDAVSTEDDEDEEHLPAIKEVSRWDTPSRVPPIEAQTREKKPVYVRIDKFQLAMESLNSVRSKLSEIDMLLKQIKEVKIKEDAELSSWETEMENVKARIQTVLDQLFDKAEY